MLFYESIDWDKKSLEFIKNTTGKLTNLKLEDALQVLLVEAGKTSQASECYFLNLNGLYIENFSPQDNNELEDIFYDFFKDDLFTLSSLNEDEVPLEEIDHPYILKLSSCILKIPLQYTDFKGLLVLGFSKTVLELGDYNSFAKLLQAKCQEVIGFISVKKPLVISRKYLDMMVFSSTDGVVFIEDQGKSAWVNHKGSSLLSIPAGQNGKHVVLEAIQVLGSKTDEGIVNRNKLLNLLDSRSSSIENWHWHFINPSRLSLIVSVSSINWGDTKGTIWIFKDADFHFGSEHAKIKVKELSNLLSSVLNCTISGIMAFKTIRNKLGEIVDFTCLISNLPANNIFKYNGQDSRGKLLKKLLPISIRNELFDHFVQVVEKNETYNAEYEYQWKGNTRWFHTIGLKLEDGFVATFTDVTDRKINEEKLVSERAQLLGILENTNDLIFSINDKNRITNLNTAFYDAVLSQTGVKLKVGDRLDYVIFSELFLPLWKYHFKRAFEGFHVMNETIVNVNGNSSFFEFSFNPIRNKYNQVTEIAVFGHDITKRKAAQSEIQQKSQLLRGILDNLPVIVFRMNTEHIFLEFNGAGVNKFKTKGNNLVGKNANEIFPELQNTVLTKNIGEKTRFFAKGSTKGQSWVFEVFIFPDESNLTEFIGFGIDVTEQQQLEKSLFKAKEVAESASLAKSYFLANQSHEIRTPINTILGFAQLIKNKSRIEESDEFLDYIISSGQTLLNIIGNILDLTKIEEGKIEFADETFNLAKKVKQETIPYKFQAIEKGLTFDLEFEKDFPTFFTGDIEKINQIIINLLGNSIKFTQVGSIKLTFSCQSINALTKTAKVRIAVSDTGIGIPLKTQKQIFSNFKQGNKTIAKNFGGSGLGLAIVRELVHLMGGQIGVSSPGELQAGHDLKGSTFWFEIPLKLAQPQKIKVQKKLDLNNLLLENTVEVLLVDDNFVNRRLGSTLLSNLGCKVTIAENGCQAVKILRKRSFNLILMDVQMPVLDGCKTTEIIRNELKLDVPIIGLSANVQKKNIDYCLSIGMNDYLGRPYSLSDFYDKVFKWVNPTTNSNFSYPEVRQRKSKLTGLSFLNQVFNGDQEKISELVEDYLNHQDNMLEKIHQAISESEFENITEMAHELRSAIQTVGLDSLYDLLIELETVSKTFKNKDVIQRLYMQIKDICNHASIELRDVIAMTRN